MCTTMRKLRRGTPDGRAAVMRKRSLTNLEKWLKSQMLREGKDTSLLMQAITSVRRQIDAIKFGRPKVQLHAAMSPVRMNEDVTSAGGKRRKIDRFLKDAVQYVSKRLGMFGRKRGQ